MQKGTEDEASLKNVGEMLVFRLLRNDRKLRLALDIREYMSLGDSATFSFMKDVDYDLFVNKLLSEVDEFLRQLLEVELKDLSSTKK